jgi:hypothetical protein
MRRKFALSHYASCNRRWLRFSGWRQSSRRGRKWSLGGMSALEVAERRRAPRHRLGRLVTIKLGVGIAPRCCLVTNISEEGVRLQLNGIEVIDEFVLLFPADVPGRSGTYKAVWRSGNDVGAKFISAVIQNA